MSSANVHNWRLCVSTSITAVKAAWNETVHSESLIKHGRGCWAAVNKEIEKSIQMSQWVKPSIFNSLESLALLTTFIFTEQFDQNLDLDGVEQSLQKSILEFLHNYFQSITELNHTLGAIIFTISSISIVLSIVGFRVRKINNVPAGYLSIAWAVELFTMNILLLSSLKRTVRYFLLYLCCL